MKKLLGVLGGMGPRASAEFIGTIYALRSEPEEQCFPPCVLYSDPTIPDRTTAIRQGDEAIVLERLTQALEALCNIPVEKVVIACVTSHYFVPKLPASLRQKVISLVDIIVAEVRDAGRRHLLLCTNGVRQVRLFENDPHWPSFGQWIVFPDPEDQQRIHEFIYRLKTSGFDESMFDTFAALGSRYEVDSFVMGCTELHGISMRLRTLAGCPRYGLVDPLFSIAKQIERYI
jgi:aspartate racemase